MLPTQQCGEGNKHGAAAEPLPPPLPPAGGSIPWVPRAVCPKVGWLDSAAMRAFDAFAGAAITVGRLRFVLPNGDELVYGTPAPPLGGAPRCAMLRWLAAASPLLL